MRKLALIGLTQALLLLAGCGGGGSGSLSTMTSNNGGGGGGTGGSQNANSVALTVDSGPQGNDVDTPFITVTVCAPGSTTNCQQIDHVEVDTGSYGLRIMSSVLSSSLAAALQQETVNGGTPVVECAQFADGFSWGPVKTADVQVSGESASSVPIEVIGDPAYLQSGSGGTSEIPAACSSTGPEEDTVASFGANGIIGIGVFADDCGAACNLAPSSNSSNPGFYYECPASGWSATTNYCTEIALPESAQVTDPAVFFQTDNNGVIVELPAAAEGAASVSGTLLFGIGTQSDNSLTAKTLLTASSSYGTVSTLYTTAVSGQQQFLPYSYFDTGSNAYYFADDGIPSGATCAGASATNPDSWFCPSSELHLSATNTGQNGTQSIVSFPIGNAYTLFQAYPGSVFDDLGASNGQSVSQCTSQSAASANQSCAFDFGFPFFLGRSVYIAFAGANTAWGRGPYIAY